MRGAQAAPAVRPSSLYVVATPLGNLADISRRACEVLAGVNWIAAEDTRHSARLLDALGIRTRLVALHAHNEAGAAAAVVEALRGGESVALITDAGTPAVSDPGARAVARVREAGFAVDVVPGPCAAVAALSISGFVRDGFVFVGFLPARPAARRADLQALRALSRPFVLYEAPHRICACVADLAALFEPERKLLIARELTKLHEESAVMPLSEAVGWLAADRNRQRGEFVLVVDAAPPTDGLDARAIDVLLACMAVLPLKEAARLTATITGASRNLLYAHGLASRDEASNNAG